jgi:hypothetical protein
VGKIYKSASTGRFVSPARVARHPSKTVTQTTGGKGSGYRSAATGRFVKKSTAERHPDQTIHEGG